MNHNTHHSFSSKRTQLFVTVVIHTAVAFPNNIREGTYAPSKTRPQVSPTGTTIHSHDTRPSQFPIISTRSLRPPNHKPNPPHPCARSLEKPKYPQEAKARIRPAATPLVPAQNPTLATASRTLKSSIRKPMTTNP